MAPRRKEEEVRPPSDTFADEGIDDLAVGDDSSVDVDDDEEDDESEEDDDEEDDSEEGDEDEDEEDDDEEEGEEDEGEEDRLPQKVYAKIVSARRKRDRAVEDLDIERGVSAKARARVEELEAEIERLKDPEPDRNEDVEGWAKWKDRDTERKIAAAARKSGGDKADANREKIIAARDAFREIHPDYDRYVTKDVQDRINSSPKLYDRIWRGKSPMQSIKAAYEYGKSLAGDDDERPRRRKTKGSKMGSGGFKQRSRERDRGGKISADQEKLLRKMGADVKVASRGLRAEARRSGR